MPAASQGQPALDDLQQRLRSIRKQADGTCICQVSTEWEHGPVADGHGATVGDLRRLVEHEVRVRQAASGDAIKCDCLTVGQCDDRVSVRV